MSNENFYNKLNDQLIATKNEGRFKTEFPLSTAQAANITLQQAGGQEKRLNLCANNYLGLANDSRLIASAKKALDEHGFGMASVRFICGTSILHQQLEQRLSTFLGQQDCILYSSCFDANTGLFETLLGPNDAIVSDSLNHASIIDGVRLCKAKRYRYANNDMDALQAQLQQARSDGAETILIATDGVFSMDGIIADLAAICDLADTYGAMVMVDDSHAVGVIGDNGRGAIEYCDVMHRVDIVTGTLGKALGGASGGYTAGKKAIIEILRQKSRPYLFSNALAPMITAAAITALDIVEHEPQRLQTLHQHAKTFRAAMTDAGFTLAGDGHPIIPIMVGDAVAAQQFSEALDAQGIMAINFSFPVVPEDKARIRTQMSAALTDDDLQQAIQGFITAGKTVGLI